MARPAGALGGSWAPSPLGWGKAWLGWDRFQMLLEAMTLKTLKKSKGMLAGVAPWQSIDS